MSQKNEVEKIKRELAGLEREISELQNANAELTKEKKILDDTLDNLPSTFYIWDDTPTLIRRNRKHDEITEYSEEEYRTMQPMDFFDKKEHPVIEAALEQVFTKGESQMEATLITKSGKKIPHLYSAVRTTIGENPVLMGFGIDISKQKQVEQQLRDALSETEVLKNQLETDCTYLDEEIKL
ncbi:MAG: PAS domain-containing protein, partial [Desulfocapsa sp.]|nr:PAS domain-containing protein [Desulfocapsa sp.]